jgi:hypothetical protein
MGTRINRIPFFLVSLYPSTMLAKKTVKNQITLPKKIVALFPDCDYFDVSAEEGRIILRPVAVDALDRVHRKLEALGIGESDISAAIQWAREKER